MFSQQKFRTILAALFVLAASLGSFAARPVHAQLAVPVIYIGTFVDPQWVNIRIDGAPLTEFDNGHVTVTGTYGTRPVDPTWTEIDPTTHEANVHLLLSDYSLSITSSMPVRWVVLAGPWLALANGITLQPHVQISGGPSIFTLTTDEGICLRSAGTANCLGNTTLTISDLIGWQITCTDAFEGVCKPQVMITASGLYLWPNFIFHTSPPIRVFLPSIAR